jgi:hypothetical protein
VVCLELVIMSKLIFSLLSKLVLGFLLYVCPIISFYFMIPVC